MKGTHKINKGKGRRRKEKVQYGTEKGSERKRHLKKETIKKS
jgi:hypothetical protein